MTNLDSILKSRDIALPTKVHLVKAMVFPVVMYGCESWTVKKVECQNIDAFEQCCWRRLLRVPWTARRFNQSILKEISPGRTDDEAETPILCPPHEKSWLIGKDPDAGRDWGQEEKGTDDREWDGWISYPTRSAWIWVNTCSLRWTGSPGGLRIMGSQSRSWLSNWTDWLIDYFFLKEEKLPFLPTFTCCHMKMCFLELWSLSAKKWNWTSHIAMLN